MIELKFTNMRDLMDEYLLPSERSSLDMLASFFSFLAWSYLIGFELRQQAFKPVYADTDDTINLLNINHSRQLLDTQSKNQCCMLVCYAKPQKHIPVKTPSTRKLRRERRRHGFMWFGLCPTPMGRKKRFTFHEYNDGGISRKP